MIHVQRPKLSSKSIFQRAAKANRTRAMKALKENRKEVLQKGLYHFFSPSFVDKARHEVNKLFHNKCAYCETLVEDQDLGDVDSFRPELNAVGVSGKVSADHYWWLSTVWENLYLSCRVCNGNKANHFPVQGSRAVPRTQWSTVNAEENRLLIDPCQDEPAEHLAFLIDGRVEGITQRGRVTVELLDLNREELLQRRFKAAKRLHTELHPRVKPPSKELALFMSESSEFLGMKRQHFDRLRPKTDSGFKTRLSDDLGLGDQATLTIDHGASTAQSSSTKLEVPTAKQRTELQRYRESVSQLLRIEIENFRIFDHLDLQFPPQEHEEEPWLILIGENGVGKSTILKAVAILCASQRKQRQLIPDASLCINRTNRARRGVVRAWFSDQPNMPVELTFRKGSKEFTHTGRKPPRIPLLAYGTTRLPPSEKLRKPRNPQRVRIANLFDPRAALGDVETYLTDTSRIDSDTFSRMAAGLRKLLGLGDDAGLISRRSGRLFIQSGKGPIELREHSDGYQSVMTLAGDIMMNLTAKTTDLESVHGTVLVDELGCHLHPQWRIRIVEALRDVFPRVRFIATTHEPLCLRGARQGEIYRLFRDESENVVADLLDIPPGLTADQLLTGQWFGLSSTLDRGTSDLIQEHSRLLRRPRLSAEEEIRKTEIEATLRHRLGSFYDTALERTVREIVADLMGDPAFREPVTEAKREAARKRIARLAKRKLRAKR